MVPASKSLNPEPAARSSLRLGSWVNATSTAVTPTNGTLSNQIYLNRHRDLGQPRHQTSSGRTSSRAPVALWHAADTDALFFTFLDPVCRLSCIVPWWLISGLLNRQVGWCVKVRVGVIQPPQTRCLVWGLGEVFLQNVGFPKCHVKMCQDSI